MVTLTISDCVYDFVTNASGYTLYVTLKELLVKHDLVQLSFRGISATSSSFLNSSLGALVEELGITVLNRIKPVDVSGTQAAILEKYVLSLRSIKH